MTTTLAPAIDALEGSVIRPATSTLVDCARRLDAKIKIKKPNARHTIRPLVSAVAFMLPRTNSTLRVIRAGLTGELKPNLDRLKLPFRTIVLWRGATVPAE